jgi:hypothetical protein
VSGGDAGEVNRSGHQLQGGTSVDIIPINPDPFNDRPKITSKKMIAKVVVAIVALMSAAVTLAAFSP